MLQAHGIVSGVSVIIHGQEKPFGVLSAHTTDLRIFTEDDTHFLQAVANVLATAIVNTHLYQEAQRRAEQMAVVFKDDRGQDYLQPGCLTSILHKIIIESEQKSSASSSRSQPQG